MSIDKMVRMNALYDQYHQLLTKKQAEMLSFYYEEDFTLAEIAAYYQISRQAVHDSIRRGEEALEQYEEMLGLFQLKKEKLTMINQLRQTSLTQEQSDLLDQLEEL